MRRQVYSLLVDNNPGVSKPYCRAVQPPGIQYRQHHSRSDGGSQIHQDLRLSLPVMS